MQANRVVLNRGYYVYGQPLGSDPVFTKGLLCLCFSTGTASLLAQGEGSEQFAGDISADKAYQVFDNVRARVSAEILVP